MLFNETDDSGAMCSCHVIAFVELGFVCISDFADSVIRRTCADFYFPAFILFVCGAFFTVSSITIALYLNRDVPDPTYLRKETKIACYVTAVVGLPALVLQFTDVLEFSAQVPVRFNWVSLILILAASLFRLRVA